MSYLTLSSEKQLIQFEKLKEGLGRIGIEEFPLQRRRFENTLIGLSSATKQRQEETEQCVSFRKYYEGGYFIEVYPTFNTKKGEFSTGGTASILVKTPSSTKGFRKRVQLYFYRQPGMVESFLSVTACFNIALQNRPYGKDGKPMDLIQEKTKNSFGIFFVSQDKKQKISILNSSALLPMRNSPHFKNFKKILNGREYYYENKPESSASIDQIKKKRRVKNPKGAVPETA